MKRFILPAIGLIAAVWSTYSVVRTQPHRVPTDPPTPPAVADFDETVAAVGLIEPSTENVSIGTPLGGVVTGVFVEAGQHVRRGDRLFELDTRQLQAELAVRQQAMAVARGRARIAEAKLADLQRQLEFAEQVKDRRAISAEELTRRRSAVETAAAELDEMRSEIPATEAATDAVRVDLERSVVRAPIAGDVLQVKVRAGEYAPAAVTSTPLIVLGGPKPFHVRVDVDEHEAWRVRTGARAIGHVRGNADLKTPLEFVRFEPFVVPKRSLTGDSTERVDTRVLEVIYRVKDAAVPLFVGQQLDVFINAAPEGAARTGGRQ